MDPHVLSGYSARGGAPAGWSWGADASVTSVRGAGMWFWGLLKTTFREWWRDNTLRMSAALAFYTTFSLSPLLVITVALAGLVFGRQQARERLASEIGTLAGPEAEAAVVRVGERAEFLSGSPLAILVGTGVVVIGSTVAFAELQRALNEIWDVQVDPRRGGPRRLLWNRLLSFGVVLGVALLLLVSLAISAGLAAVQAHLADRLPQVSWAWRGAHEGAAVLVVGVLFALIYRLLPDVQIGWRDVAVGALVTSVLFNLGKFLIGLYLGQAVVGSAYAAAGSLGALLSWVYYSALICFFGAEFTQVYARRFGSGIRPRSHAVRLGRKPDRAVP